MARAVAAITPRMIAKPSGPIPTIPVHSTITYFAFFRPGRCGLSDRP